MKNGETYTNISEAIEAFGLNFDVAKTPIYTKIDDIEQQIDDKVATYRTDNLFNLGIVGNNYEIVQNSDQFAVFQKFADEGLVSFENGGIFGNGRRTYIQAVLPSTIDINLDRGDMIKKYITIVSSHDGTISLQAFVSDVRIICRNTFMLAIKTGQHKTKIKHTSQANNRLDEAIKIIEVALETHKELDEFVLASTRTRDFKAKEVEKFVELMIPAVETGKGKDISTRKINQRQELLETIHSGIGQDVISNMNAYKLWNGVTTWTNNVMAMSDKVDNPLEFLTYQNGAKINSQAFELVSKILQNDMILS